MGTAFGVLCAGTKTWGRISATRKMKEERRRIDALLLEMEQVMR